MERIAIKEKEVEIPELTIDVIDSMIYVVRGVKVMLDFELAKIYGYETRYFNRQVNNNIEKFDSDFMFQLTKEEFNKILMCKNFTSSWGGTRKLPYAFTEQGVYMLMTVLKGELAIKQSKALIRTCKKMKDYIIDNKDLLYNNESVRLIHLIMNNTNRIDKIENKLDIVMANFLDVPSNHYLILNGEKTEANNAYQSIYESANKSIYIVDDYIDIKTLQLLKVCKAEIEIIIFSDNRGQNNLNKNFVKDFISDTGFNIKFKKNNNRFHDRYIILDYDTEYEKLYHCGASSKDAGKKLCAINKIENTEMIHSVIDKLLMGEDKKI